MTSYRPGSRPASSESAAKAASLKQCDLEPNRKSNLDEETLFLRRLLEAKHSRRERFFKMLHSACSLHDRSIPRRAWARLDAGGEASHFLTNTLQSADPLHLDAE
jgi:hypothetical protein